MVQATEAEKQKTRARRRKKEREKEKEKGKKKKRRKKNIMVRGRGNQFGDRHHWYSSNLVKGGDRQNRRGRNWRVKNTSKVLLTVKRSSEV